MKHIACNMNTKKLFLFLFTKLLYPKNAFWTKEKRPVRTARLVIIKKNYYTINPVRSFSTMCCPASVVSPDWSENSQTSPIALASRISATFFN